MTATGLLALWVGGYLLSSGFARCTDGGTCTGPFASDTWHLLGLLAVVVGLCTLIGATVMAVRAHQRNRAPAH